MTVFGELGVGDIVIDCGAHIGRMTKILASEGATVHAFEPMEKPYKLLAKKFKMSMNVHCYNKGLFNKTKNVRLYYSKEFSSGKVKVLEGASMFPNKRNVEKDNYYSVQVIDVSKFIKNLPKRVKLLKINVEGAECAILERLVETGVIYSIDRIVVALHGDKIPKLQKRINKLRVKAELLGITHIEWDWWAAHRNIFKLNLCSLGKQVLFGIAPDVYSTAYLAHLFNQQHDVYFPVKVNQQWLPWKRDVHLMESRLAQILKYPGFVVGESSPAYLNYVQDIIRKFPSVKFVCLKRVGAQIVNSLRKKNFSAYVASNKCLYGMLPLQASKEDLEKYQVSYFKNVDKLIKVYPNNVICIGLGDLENDKSAVKNLFRFIKLRKNDRNYDNERI